jgi:hypothetical protein
MKNNKNIITKNKVIIYALIDIALIIFIFIPHLKKNNEYRQEINNLQKEAELLLSNSQTINGAQNKYKKLAPEMEDFKKMFIGEDEELDLVIFLEKIAEESNLTQEISIKKEENSIDNLKKLLVNIQLEGNFKGTLTYIDDIEKNNFNIDIISINMNSQEDTVFSKIYAEILYN